MGALPLDWGVPTITPFNEAWFTSGAIVIQRCASCAALQHPPEEVCHACGSMAFDSVTLAPTGTVHSYTVVHYAANAALADMAVSACYAECVVVYRAISQGQFHR